jgi:hypothetical protein
LLREAKSNNKISSDYEIPAQFLNNTPERIAAALKPAKERGLLPDFPFGTDFTDVELRIIPALQLLKQKLASPLSLVRVLLRGLTAPANAATEECIERMRLTNAASLKDKIYRALLRGALSR